MLHGMEGVEFVSIKFFVGHRCFWDDVFSKLLLTLEDFLFFSFLW